LTPTPNPAAPCSLFLLTRFNEERANGRPISMAVEVALATQGHTIVVSGATLALCFTSMLVLPTSTITSMAAGAATAVLQSVRSYIYIYVYIYIYMYVYMHI